MRKIVRDLQALCGNVWWNYNGFIIMIITIIVIITLIFSQWRDVYFN